MMPYFRILMVFFQFYTVFSVYGTVKLIQKYGLFNKEGGFNVFTA